jgi:AraC-like DNA-binding protein
MSTQEWARYWHNPQLDTGLLHAFYRRHAYPRHAHDYYVMSVIGYNVQSFTHGSAKHFTPPGGIILINPQEVHTGEPANEHGYEMRSLYPSAASVQNVVCDLMGRQSLMPSFTQPRVDDPQTASQVIALHQSLTDGSSLLECETRFVQTIARLVKRYGNIDSRPQQVGRERKAVQQARRYIEEHFVDGVSLQDLADYVALSPYYLLTVFHHEVGMPPYTYLESVRVRHAQRLIELGRPLINVALEAGFSSQSHFTHRFKRIIGVTPGQYAQEFKAQH